MEWWDAGLDADLQPVVVDKALGVWVGLDASHKRDQTAIVACTFDQASKRVRLVWHRVFQPSKKNPLDFEATIETSMHELRDRFLVTRALYDPHMLQSEAFPASDQGGSSHGGVSPDLESPRGNGHEPLRADQGPQPPHLLRQGDDAVLRPGRGSRIAALRKIAKEKTSHKIDVVVALAMAALGAVESGGRPPPGGPFFYTDIRNDGSDEFRIHSWRRPGSAARFLGRHFWDTGSWVIPRCPPTWSDPTTSRCSLAVLLRVRSYDRCRHHDRGRVHPGVLPARRSAIR